MICIIYRILSRIFIPVHSHTHSLCRGTKGRAGFQASFDLQATGSESCGSQWKDEAPRSPGREEGYLATHDDQGSTLIVLKKFALRKGQNQNLFKILHRQELGTRPCHPACVLGKLHVCPWRSSSICPGPNWEKLMSTVVKTCCHRKALKRTNSQYSYANRFVTNSQS